MIQGKEVRRRMADQRQVEGEGALRRSMLQQTVHRSRHCSSVKGAKAKARANRKENEDRPRASTDTKAATTTTTAATREDARS